MSAQASLPTGRRGRLLALGVTVAVMLAIWLAVVAPLADLYARRADRLEQREALARHMEQLAASRPVLEKRAGETSKQAHAPSTLTGSVPVATAALQGVIQDIATGAGVSLASVESLPGESAAGFRRVGVKLTLSASWPVMIHFLQSIAQSGTPMVVDDLQIRGTPLQARTDQQILDAGLSIHALAGPDRDMPAESPAGPALAPGTRAGLNLSDPR